MNDGYTTLTEIGKLFGVSAQNIGKVLTQEGWRDLKTRHPSVMAVHKKLFIWSTIPTGQRFCLWRAKDVVEMLHKKGYTPTPVVIAASPRN